MDPIVLVEKIMDGTQPDETPTPQGDFPRLEIPTFDLMDTTSSLDDSCNRIARTQRKRMAEDGSPKSEEEEECNISYRLRRRKIRVKELRTDEEEEETVVEESEIEERRSDTEVVKDDNGEESSKAEAEDKERKLARPKRKTRKVIGTPEIELGKNFEQFVKTEFKEVGAVSLGALGSEWLEDIDTIRSKCGRLQGKLNGQMKDRVGRLKDVIKALVEKAESVGDPLTLRMRINKLKYQLEVKEEDDRKRGEEITELRRINAELRNELKDLRGKVNILMDKNQAEDQDREEKRMKAEVGRQEKKDKKKKREKSFLEERIELIRKDDPSVRFITAPKTVVDGKLVSSSKPETEVDRINKEIRNKEKEIAELLRSRIEARKSVKEEDSRQEEEQVGKDMDKEEGMDVEMLENGENGTREMERDFPPFPQRPPRPIPRVKLNIQIKPPRENNAEAAKGSKEGNREEIHVTSVGKETGSWTEVVKKGKKARKNKTQEQGGKENKDREVEDGEDRKGEGGKEQTPKTPVPVPRVRTIIGGVKVRIPKTAAVTITGQGENFPYDTVLRKARENIQLNELGIEKSKLRKAANGGYILEIPGPKNDEKADVLAAKLREVLPSEVRVAKPQRKAEIRIIGFDGSVSKDEVIFAIEDVGKCKTEEVKVGEIRKMNNGLCTIWVQCPLTAAATLASKGKIKIGWTMARVETLKARPIQCYRCWEFGHLKNACQSKLNRVSSCFKCGTNGHSIKECTSPHPQCVICKEKNMDGNHRIGSIQCESLKVYNDNVSIRTEDGANNKTK